MKMLLSAFLQLVVIFLALGIMLYKPWQPIWPRVAILLRFVWNTFLCILELCLKGLLALVALVRQVHW